MTVLPLFLAAIQRPNSGLPRWAGRMLTSRTRDEGDPVQFSIACSNPKVGSRIVFWMTGGGGLGSNGNWLYKWIDVLTAAGAEIGLEITALGTSTVPPKEGTISFLIVVTQKYVDLGASGTPLIVNNIIRKNRKNNAANAGDIRGGAGSFQLLFKAVTVPALTAPETPANTYGTFGTAPGFINVRDTSRRPAGVPTFKIASFDPVTGGTALTNLFEGDSFRVVLQTTNMIPGTQIKVYVANKGENDITPRWRTAVKQAALAAGCECYVPGYRPSDPKSWYNGGTITFTEQYDDTKPIEVVLTVDERKEPEGVKQFDLVSTVVQEGDALDFEEIVNKGDYNASATYVRGDYIVFTDTGRMFIATEPTTTGNSPPTDEATYENTYWRELIKVQGNGSGISKMFRDRPPTYWEIRAEKSGSNVLYSIKPPTKIAPPNVIRLRSTNEPLGFRAAFSSQFPLISDTIYKTYQFVNDNAGDLELYGFNAKYMRVKMGTGKYKAGGLVDVPNPYFDPKQPESEDNWRYNQEMSMVSAPIAECDFDDNTSPYFYVYNINNPTHVRTLDNEYVAVSYNGNAQWQRLNRFPSSGTSDFFPAVNGRYVSVDKREGGDVGHKVISQTATETLYELVINDDVGRAFNMQLQSADVGKHIVAFENEQPLHYVGVRQTCVYMTDVGLPNDPANVYGVNLAGGDFGDVFNNATGTYSTYRTDGYRYPAKPEYQNPAHRHLLMDYHWREGSRIARLPFRWERIQPQLFGPLYYGPLDEPFTSNNRLDMRRIDDCVDYWTKTLGGVMLLDLHNYMDYYFGTYYNEDEKKYKGISEKVRMENITTLGNTPEALIDVWLKLANKYADNEKVWFGIMNEPEGGGQTPSRTAAIMQTVVNAIRCYTPARNKILVAGCGYTNMKKWVTEGNAAAFDDFLDPLGNVAYEPHNYINPDQSGAGATAVKCVVQTATSNQVLDFCNWLRAKPGRRGLVGEFAGGNPNFAGGEECAKSVPATYKLMHDTYKDVLIGYTAWGANFGKSYPYALDPPDEKFDALPLPDAVSPCMAMLKPWLAGDIP